MDLTALYAARELVRELLTWPFAREVLGSAVVLVAGWVARKLATRRIDRLGLDPDDRLRWRVTARNLVLGAVGVLLVIVWQAEIREVLISIVAIGASLVIAMKEVILCISGATYRSFAKAFSVGDRIEVAGWRGDVIDFGPLATTLLEVGPGPGVHQTSGRTVVLPNSLFMLHPVVNETFTESYVLHPFTIAIPRGEDWARAERVLLDAANEVCEPYLQEATGYFGARMDRFSVVPLSVEPRVHLRLHDPGRIELLVRVPVPVRQKGRIEQAIIHRYLERTTS